MLRKSGSAFASTGIENRLFHVHGLNEALAAWEQVMSDMPGLCVRDDVLIAQAKSVGAQMLFPAHLRSNCAANSC